MPAGYEFSALAPHTVANSRPKQLRRIAVAVTALALAVCYAPVIDGMADQWWHDEDMGHARPRNIARIIETGVRCRIDAAADLLPVIACSSHRAPRRSQTSRRLSLCPHC